jgi:hypothetical protein
MKQLIRHLGLRFLDLFSTEITDCVSGARLGRGLVLGWGGRVHVIGYAGRPLVPMFVPQGRLCFWKQEIGFTAHPAPDFPRIAPHAERLPGERVLNLVVTHQGGAAFADLLKAWDGVCNPEDLWIVFGGSRSEFEALGYPRKVFVDDPDIRTRDHQREKQSYAGLLQAVRPIVEREAPDYVHLCEFDHLPAVTDLNKRQIRALREEGADVMAHYLVRTDRTGHPIALSHEGDPDFLGLWRSITRRDGAPAVFWMFGSGSLWTRDAFLAVAATPLTAKCYFEIHLPTLAHHLGYRIRCWNEKEHLISNKPSPLHTVARARQSGCWTVHPVK